jgi:two-component system sensor histidine kinase CpxA
MFSRPGQITADPELLSRAVENVLRNAIRYNPPGSPIEVSAGGDGEYVFVTIRDRGRGVPDEALDDIFRPLYRVERSRTRRGGGAGLGLAIARRAITIHGGTIRADNCSPGLRIEIRLRRRRASQAGHNS